MATRHARALRRLSRTAAGDFLLTAELAWDTGRRIGAILALRWSDRQPDQGKYGMLRWRVEEDKVRRE